MSFSTGSSNNWDRSSTAFSRSLAHGTHMSARKMIVGTEETHACISSNICFWFPGTRKYAIAYDHLSVRRHLVSSSTAVCMNVACIRHQLTVTPCTMINKETHTSIHDRLLLFCTSVTFSSARSTSSWSRRDDNSWLLKRSK